MKIADAPPISPIFEAFKSGHRWFLVWLGIHEDKQLFEGIYSDDQGQTWKQFAFEELRGFNQGGIDVATTTRDTFLSRSMVIGVSPILTIPKTTCM